MTIIAIFACLFAERFLSSLSGLRSFEWFHRYSQFVCNSLKTVHFKSGKATVLIIVAFPAIVVGLIDQKLYQFFLPLEFLFSTFVLLYCLGPQAFYDRSKALCHAEDINDNSCASWYAEKILDRPLERHEKINLPHIITQSLFTITNDRILAPIFWFILLGPMGAVLFRCSSQLYLRHHKNNEDEMLAQSIDFFYAILNWVPCRLSALGFAAMGNFSESLNRYTQVKGATFNLTQKSNELLLITMGSGAIDLPEKPNETPPTKIAEALAILRRNTQLWMGSIALFTLAGWLG